MFKVMLGTPATTRVLVAWLLAVLMSLVALVVPISAKDAATVGVPDATQVTVASWGTALPLFHCTSPIEQAPWAIPVGKPEIAQLVPDVASADPVLVQVKFPS